MRGGVGDGWMGDKVGGREAKQRGSVVRVRGVIGRLVVVVVVVEGKEDGVRR